MVTLDPRDSKRPTFDLYVTTYLDPKRAFSTYGSITYVPGQPDVSSELVPILFTGTFWKHDRWRRSHSCSIELDDCLGLVAKYSHSVSQMYRTKQPEREQNLPRTTQNNGLGPPRCRTAPTPTVGCDRCKLVPLRNIKMYYSQVAQTRDMCALHPVPLLATEQSIGGDI